MNILITGAGGYIGSTLPKHFNTDNVTILEDFRHGKSGAWKTLSGKKQFYDCIVHLAWPRLQDFTEKDHKFYLDLTESLAKQTEKMVFASTCSVYGKQEYPVDERSRPNPQDDYAWAKLEAERGLPDSAIVLRFATVFGESPLMRNDTLVNQFVHQAKTEKSLEIHNGSALRPIVHISDVGKAIDLAVHDGFKPGIYNVGGENWTKNDLGEEILKHFKASLTITDKSDSRDYAVSFAKIQTTQFRARTSFKKWLKTQ